jgi:hypothetical protein
MLRNSTDLSDLTPAVSARVRSRQLNKALWALTRELHGHGLLPLEEGLLDGTFASAKKGLGRGADQAWQGDENNGHRRCYQSSSGRHRR